MKGRIVIIEPAELSWHIAFWQVLSGTVKGRSMVHPAANLLAAVPESTTRRHSPVLLPRSTHCAPLQHRTTGVKSPARQVFTPVVRCCRGENTARRDTSFTSGRAHPGWVPVASPLSVRLTPSALATPP